MTQDQDPPTRRLTRRLLAIVGRKGSEDSRTIAELVTGLGDRSFGWLILIFAMVNLIPMPVGGNMITSIPLIIVVAQMALGLPRVRLPGFILRRQVGRRAWQKLVLRMRPIIRPIERMTKPRHLYVFGPGFERVLGAFMLVVAICLFLPLPGSGYIPATSLFIFGLGLVERDGLVTLLGAVLGLVAIIITSVVGGMIVLGARALAG